MRNVPRRVLTALSLAMTMALLPMAADACEGDGPGAPDLTALYLYRKVNPAKPASWGNSGRQQLVLIRDGHVWNRTLDASLLPDGVCGPGWGVQEDQTHGLVRAQVPAVVDRATGTGVLPWPPITAARHKDLEYYLTVPPCEEPPPVAPGPPSRRPSPVLNPRPSRPTLYCRRS